MRNCPNCGAAITSRKCEYCGTKFDSNEAGHIENTVYGELDGMPLHIAFKKALYRGYRMFYAHNVIEKSYEIQITTPSRIKYKFSIPEYELLNYPMFDDIRDWIDGKKVYANSEYHLTEEDKREIIRRVQIGEKVHF